MAKRPLTERQRRFVEAYLTTGNAAESARRAGYGAKNSDVEGGRLLRNAGIRSAVDDAKAASAKRTEIDLDRVVKEYATIAFANPDESGEVSTLAYEHKLKALHDLCDHLGGFKQTVKHEGSVNLIQVVDPYAKPAADADEDCEGDGD